MYSRELRYPPSHVLKSPTLHPPDSLWAAAYVAMDIALTLLLSELADLVRQLHLVLAGALERNFLVSFRGEGTWRW